MTTNRNFDTISPSAKSLLFMKAHTTIPYAQQTAELVASPRIFTPDFEKKDFTFWARVLHFENRYLSVDQLLSDLRVTNILELSSGYSFRGLDKTRDSNCNYIDTDLPDVISTKKEIVDELRTDNHKGVLEILPLNALDEDQFRKVVTRFPAGNIVIINEGLLMYLSATEKEVLCRIIHSILKERGGYWITADVYIKDKVGKLNLEIDGKTKHFFDKHNIEENLKNGNLRLIIASDELNEPLRTTITFLNSYSNFDILLLQISSFEENKNKKVTNNAIRM